MSGSGYSAEQFVVLLHRLCVMGDEDVAAHVFDRLASASKEGERVRAPSCSTLIMNACLFVCLLLLPYMSLLSQGG